MTGRGQDEDGLARDAFAPVPRSTLRDENLMRPARLPRREGTWRPEAGSGTLIGVFLLIVSAAVLLLALQAFTAGSGFARVVWLLVALAALAGTLLVSVLLVRLRSMRYTVTAVGLAVSARGQRINVPYEEIVEVVFRPRDRIDVGGYERFWPGYHDAEVATSEGIWRSVATTPPNLRVRLRLRDGRTLAISPERPILFVEAIESFRRGARPSTRRAAPLVRPHSPSSRPPAIAQDAPASGPPAAGSARPRPELPDWLGPPQALILFRDRVVRGDTLASNLLALALILLILLVTVTVWRADAVGLPTPIHWNAAGEPDRFVRPGGFWIFEGVWIFPATAAAVVVVNAALATFAIYVNQLRAAQVLLAAALPVEALLLIALLRATA